VVHLLHVADAAGELSQRRTSKFFNRALPDPPSALPSSTNSASVEKDTCPTELTNLYELIAQSTTTDHTASVTAVSNTVEMYEDIDDCLERADAAITPFDDSLSCHQSSVSKGSFIQQVAQNPPDDEYLEPVIPPEEELKCSSNFCPSPAPRCSLSAAAEVQQTSYVNAGMMWRELPSLADGFAAMTEICREALVQIAERITAQYVNATWPTGHGLELADFEVADDGQMELVQPHVSFFRARHAELAPKGCLLMVRLLTILFVDNQTCFVFIGRDSTTLLTGLKLLEEHCC